MGVLTNVLCLDFHTSTRLGESAGGWPETTSHMRNKRSVHLYSSNPVWAENKNELRASVSFLLFCLFNTGGPELLIKRKIN